MRAGQSLESLDLDPGETAGAWREVGCDLAMLHTRVVRTGPVATLAAAEAIPDPRELLETRATEGWFTRLEVRWISRWLNRIAPAATVEVPLLMLHSDVQGTNIIVAPDTHDYVAILDWGCTGWGDPAWDIGGPLRAAPHILAGYREVAPLDRDESAEARVLWRHIQMVLYVLPRGATPGLSWVEHPLARLLEIARFFFDKAGGAWAELRP
ncbi:MAG: aminoglycoside phosphotransferase family protein [Chloroflexota bacterium]|nr:aminoglycoside phosphotransferase family protein [Chloroflexota bacterium]